MAGGLRREEVISRMLALVYVHDVRVRAFASSCPRLPGDAAKMLPRNVKQGFAETDNSIVRQEADNETRSWERKPRGGRALRLARTWCATN